MVEVIACALVEVLAKHAFTNMINENSKIEKAPFI